VRAGIIADLRVIQESFEMGDDFGKHTRIMI